MWKKGFILWVIIPLIVTCIPSASAQSSFQSGLYRITSGTYTECCGIAGATRYTLPNGGQSFVRLTIDSRNLATMTFLGQDAHTVFSRMACPPAPRIDFDFEYGFIHSEQIFFHVDPGPDGLYWNYVVSNAAGGLRIDGIVEKLQQRSCADVPTRFTDTNVVAVFIPPPRLSITGYSKDRGAKLFLQGHAGHTNLIEASADLVTWTAVSTNVMDYSLCPICPFAIFEDAASTNLPRRFYRAFEYP